MPTSAYYVNFENLDFVELINGAQHTHDGKVYAT